MTMTTAWLLLLLLLIASSQSVVSQSTIDDDEDTCASRGLLSILMRDIGRMLDNQQQLFHRLGKLKFLTNLAELLSLTCME